MQLPENTMLLMQTKTQKLNHCLAPAVSLRHPARTWVFACICLFAAVTNSAASLASLLPPLQLTAVTAQVYVAVGDTGPPTYENTGHNNNLSVIITDTGVVVVNGGDNYQLAARLHQAIKLLTPLPVVWVINENGQGHAFLGNSYWRDQGVKIIAHKLAADEISSHGEQTLQRMISRNRDKSAGTYVAEPDIIFEQRYMLEVGTTTIELISFGEAHSPGDISVWLAEQQVLIAGDIAFHQRLLAIFPDTNVSAWIDSFDRMAALEPEIVIPGHGEPTDIATLRKYTQGYLQFLTREVQAILDADGGLQQAYAIDQSAYAHLHTFDELAAKNAGRLFQTMEMEAF